MNTTNNTLPDFAGIVKRHYVAKDRPSVARSTWASSVGHPCERCLVYERTQGRPAIDDGDLLRLFAVGSQVGQQVVRDLQDALAPLGWQVGEQEVPLPMNPFNITGRVDCVLVSPRGADGERGERIPCEVKKLAAYTFDKVDTFDDLRHGDMLHLRRYAGQLAVYVGLLGARRGIFYLRCAEDGRDKVVEYQHDEGFFRSLCERAARVESCVGGMMAMPEAERPAALPQRVPFSRLTCGRCPFASVCLPDMVSPSGVIDGYSHDEVDTACAEYLATKEAAAKHERANKVIGKFIESAVIGASKGDIRTVVFAGHTVEVTVGERTTYDIPDEVKARYKGKAVTLRKSVEAVGQKGVNHAAADC